MSLMYFQASTPEICPGLLALTTEQIVTLLWFTSLVTLLYTDYNVPTNVLYPEQRTGLRGVTCAG